MWQTSSVAEHAKPWTFGDFVRRFVIGMRDQLRQRLPGDTWRGRLRFIAGLIAIWFCLLVPYSYPRAETYLTGDPVTARITRCDTPSGGNGPRRGYWCDGSWTLRDGTRGSARIEGIAQRTPVPVGTPIAVRATADSAVTDSARWIIQLTVGVLGCLITAVLIARLFVHLIRATRPPGGTPPSPPRGPHEM
ncbi:hypothetical protein NS506_07636 [Nocardia seriolae]|uniref:Uncharacterized protein n=1 Tax=Nocardia seriolae TaxID=37332 RepID=A0ABC8B4Q4_9NOCA|nr:hypothetical protein NS506_07636 [Nocardia seriolae]GEM28244.1 hypothetical protein NS2_64830 [Nocardia seriolae NBRC 15557]OJF78284.1 hypothetical protein NS14008_02495 [Nocardia seriolae]PSK29792.1 hypothetical protein C6575_19065 [Nocardia seriolae]RLP25655.1 hypothetical protein D6158_31970 [Nocardia seriolae]